MVKALDLRSNGRVVRVGSNPTPGTICEYYSFLSMAGKSYDRASRSPKEARMNKTEDNKDWLQLDFENCPAYATVFQSSSLFTVESRL